jgi:hypothetical protein
MSLTNDLVLERLVVLDGFTITLALMFFAIEILDCLVVQKAVCVDAACDLSAWLSCVYEKTMGGRTVSRSFMARRKRVRQRVRRTLTTTK